MMTFNDVLLLLVWLISVSFAAYIISDVANFFPKFFASFIRSYKDSSKYDKDYSFKVLRFIKIPAKKEGKKNHGRTIRFLDKFR